MNVLLLELRNLRKGFITSTVSFTVVIFLMLAFFPSMQTESMRALANAKMDGLDPAVLAAFGLSKMFDFTVISNYFGYALQFITLAMMVVITQRAVALLIKEETDGTIEYLCAKPVSRWQIFLQKTLAHILLFAVSLVIYTATTTIGYLMFTDYTFTAALKESAIFYSAIFFIGLVFSSVGLLISALIKSGKGVAGITTAIVFGTFILGVMSEVVKKLDFLIWLSPMDWIKANKLLTDGILWQEWLVGLGVIIICTAGAWLFYRKKDLVI